MHKGTGKAQATLLPVTLSSGVLSAGGFHIIRNLGSSLFPSPEAEPAAGMVLGAAASDGMATAVDDTAVGRLVCNRCGMLLMKNQQRHGYFPCGGTSCIPQKGMPKQGGRMRRFLACARIKIYWMTPEWGCSAKDLPPETQFLLLQLSPSGPYAIILPLIDSGKFRVTLRPPR